MRLFRKKKEDSVQSRINELKHKRGSHHHGHAAGDEAPEELEPIEALSPEEQEFLEEMERNLKSGQSILKNSRTAQEMRRSLMREHSAVRLDEGDIEDDKSPFEAEHEVESMVREAQKRFEVPPRSEDEEYEPDDYDDYDDEVDSGYEDEDYEDDYEEDPSEEVRQRRQADVEASYDDPGEMPHPPGSIVRMSDDTLAIIKEEIPEREYDLVYTLSMDGKLEPRGMVFFQHDTERLGRLPQAELKRLEKTMTWNRDHLIYYMDSVEFAEHIPHPKKADAPSTPAKDASKKAGESAGSQKALERGRMIEIRFGERNWNAVYWGSNDNGAILAHNSVNDSWELVHMNLQRFGDNLQIGEKLSSEEIKEIERRIIENHQGENI